MVRGYGCYRAIKHPHYEVFMTESFYFEESLFYLENLDCFVRKYRKKQCKHINLFPSFHLCEGESNKVQFAKVKWF